MSLLFQGSYGIQMIRSYLLLTFDSLVWITFKKIWNVWLLWDMDLHSELSFASVIFGMVIKVEYNTKVWWNNVCSIYFIESI